MPPELDSSTDGKGSSAQYSFSPTREEDETNTGDANADEEGGGSKLDEEFDDPEDLDLDDGDIDDEDDDLDDEDDDEDDDDDLDEDFEDELTELDDEYDESGNGDRVPRGPGRDDD